MRAKYEYRPSCYVFGAKELSWYKIGFSSNPQQRFVAIAASLPFPIQVVHIFEAKTEMDARLLETYLLTKCKSFRLNGEWFRLSDEQVNKLEEHVEYMRDILVFGRALSPNP